MEKYKVIDLFAGAGGLSYGFLQTDRFRLVAAAEIQQGQVPLGNEDTTLYCLSTYSCGCLHKESIKQSRNIFNITIGNVKLSANTEVHIGDSLKFYLLV